MSLSRGLKKKKKRANTGPINCQIAWLSISTLSVHISVLISGVFDSNAAFTLAPLQYKNSQCIARCIANNLFYQ